MSLLRASTSLRSLTRPAPILRLRLMSTKQYEFILTERPADGVALIRLNRPKALNALSSPLFEELNDAVAAFDKDNSVRALVLTGSERAFAGASDVLCEMRAHAVAVQRARISRR